MTKEAEWGRKLFLSFDTTTESVRGRAKKWAALQPRVRLCSGTSSCVETWLQHCVLNAQVAGPVAELERAGSREDLGSLGSSSSEDNFCRWCERTCKRNPI